MTKPAQDSAHFHCIEKEVPWEAARKGKTEEGKKKTGNKNKELYTVEYGITANTNCAKKR